MNKKELNMYSLILLTVWTPKSLGQDLLMTILEDRACSVTRIIYRQSSYWPKKQNLQIYRVYFIRSVNFVPHFGHPKSMKPSLGHPVSKYWLRPCLGIDPREKRVSCAYKLHWICSYLRTQAGLSYTNC